MAVTEQARARVVYRPSDQRSARPTSGPGRLWVLALVAVVFAGGMVIGRSTTRPAVTQDPTAPRATAASPAATAPAPGAASTPGVTAGTPAASPAASAKAGPRQVVDGVGVGWAHSRQGALAAATNYATVLGGDLVFDTQRRHKAVVLLAAPEARAELQRAWDGAVPVLRKALRLPADGPVADKIALRTAPFGHSIERYDDASARVSIWTVALAGSTTGIPVQSGWGITTIDLKWVGGDWKEVRATTRTAPTPLSLDTEVPSAASAFVQLTQQFKEYDHAAGS
ncbi:MAG TPA: hypothetical protein VG276_08130 [Actinomycetes bacterium]|nr:hypothetical protein [Actinomycetes bacterium]